MPLTIREELIRKFTARAQTLSPVEVKRVLRSQPEGLEKFISIWDGDEQVIGAAFGKDSNQFAIQLIAEWNTCDTNASEAVNAFMGEVITAILSPNHDMDGMADSIEKFSMIPTYPNDGSNISILSAVFLIKFKTVRGNPYLQ